MCTFPDIPVKKLRYSALIRERGGVGYYPTSATPFVHLDTDRVRAWPRVPRMELALLFPNGRTQHVPDDGGPITPEDVRSARAANSEVAQQIAEFHDLRTRPKPPIQVASLAPSLPQLLMQPRPWSGRPRSARAPPTESGLRSRRWRTNRCRSSSSARCRPPARARPRSCASGEMRVAAADPDTARHWIA